MTNGRTRELWGSRIGVIMAVAGSAVGLGNFLRFPGNAAQNGGGAFMLPYFISLLILGIPLCWCEWTMGRYAGVRGSNSAPAIYTMIWPHPLAKYFGGLALIIPLIIYMYYVLIESWCLGYAISYLTGALMKGDDAAAYGSFFSNFVGDQQDGALLAAGNRHWLWLLVGTFALNFCLIYRGVTKGIEQFCKVGMPFMIVLAIIVLVRVLTLGTPDPTRPDQSVVGGLGFMWNPKPAALLDGKTWLAASGQIFFSLSVGFGIIINYASYLRENDDVALSGLTSSSVNEFFEVCLGGLITLPAAFIFLGAATSDFAGSTFSLGFQAMPNVFAQMPAGRLFGFLWFFMLFVAAVTSSVSMLQPVIAFLEEGFALKRHASAAILGLVSAIGCGYVMYFSKGLVALDTFDFWVGSFLIFVLAMVQALLYGWVFGIVKGNEELHRGAHIRIPRFVQFVLKYIVPVYLLGIFVIFCVQKLPSWELEKFRTTAGQPTALDAGVLPEPFLAAFTAQGLDLPDNTRVVRDARSWTVLNQDDTLAYRVVADGEEWVVSAPSPGYLETVGKNPVALNSVLFVALIFTFVLILIHIAGRRWAAEGRFTKLGDAT